MRRILTMILVLILVISTATSVAFADSWKNWTPPGLEKTGGLPPGIAKKFLDIDGYKWAEKAIERMAERGVIKGVGEGKFAPNRAVTKLEAIVMALRIMGEEDEARAYFTDIKEGKKKFKLKDQLQEWAYGYVALAEDKGILDEADLVYFKLNEPATRHEVAKYLVRAMGLEDDAQDNMDKDLDYVDAAYIPQGSVGYIYIANKEKIITGYEDDTFRPFRIVTRAEMAVMIARIDGDIDDDDDNDDYDTYKGEVTDIDKDYDWIEIDDKKEFEITKKTDVVFEDDEEGSIKDIEEGDEVKVTFNDDDEAIIIKAYKDLYDEYEGEVEKIDDDYDWIEIELEDEDEDTRFDIADDVEVVFEDDEEGDIEDIKVGDDVEIKVNSDDEITYIEVDRELDVEEYTGSVTYIEEDDDEYEFSVLTSDEVEEFEVDDDFEVQFDDEEGTIDDLRIGDEVVVVVNDDEVSKITVDRDIDEEIINGKIYDIYEDDEIVIKDDDGIRRKYALDDDVKVFLDDEDDELSSLKKDDYVGLKIDDDKVVEIKAYRD